MTDITSLSLTSLVDKVKNLILILLIILKML